MAKQRTHSRQEQAARDRDSKRIGAARTRSADLAVEIGAPADQARRERCGASLADFLRTYWPDEFAFPFSADQEEQIAATEGVIRAGGRLVILAPRGDGKTTRTVRAALWALLYRVRGFVVILAADGPAAERCLEIIRADLMDAGDLADDFPEVCRVFEKSEGSPIRCRALHHDGKKLHAQIQKDRLVFPTLDGAAAGQVLLCRGLTAALRGINHRGRARRVLRPDLVLCDDVQTDESARSPGQTEERESLLAGAVAGLAGPRSDIAIVALLTTIRKGDLPDRLADAKRHPEWTVRKYAMVYKWPEAGALWDAYSTLLRTPGGKGSATAYYAANRAGMDAGSRVGWEHRVRAGELSAIQTAWNLRAEVGESAFGAEYQNEPRQVGSAAFEVSAERVAEQLAPTGRGIVPAGAELLTVGVDVNLYGCTFAVIAWTAAGTGTVIDYGKHPPGIAAIWTPKSPHQLEPALHAAAVATLGRILATRYTREDGGERVDPAMIAMDCSFQRDVIIAACRAARVHAGACRIAPLRGVSGRHYTQRSATRKGDGWHLAAWPSETVLFCNVDLWRARQQRAWLVPPGGPGSLNAYAGAADKHGELARHISAEKLVDILAGQRLEEVYVWHLAPGERNDLADAVVYAMVAAAHLGISAQRNIAKASRPQREPQPQGQRPDPVRVAPLPDDPRTRPARRPQRGGWVARW